MFDPFGDYADAGYLRNRIGEKDLELVKVAEHELFRAQLPRALSYLASCKRIGYQDFLEVHRILFDGLYPWAGQDRAQVLPERAVNKGNVYFCHPRDCQRAVNEGLSLAQDKKLIATRPGFVMGMFAYGHPFLDGNQFAGHVELGGLSLVLGASGGVGQQFALDVLEGFHDAASIRLRAVSNALRGVAWVFLTNTCNTSRRRP